MITTRQISEGALIDLAFPDGRVFERMKVISVKDGIVTFGRKNGGRGRWWLAFDLVRERGVRSSVSSRYGALDMI